MELAAHRSLAGAQLKTFKDFVTVIAKVWVVLLRLYYWVSFSMGWDHLSAMWVIGQPRHPGIDWYVPVREGQKWLRTRNRAH